MKKRTVITTEKLEVWAIHPAEVPNGVAQAPETTSSDSESSNESLTSWPEEHPDKNVPPTHED